MRLERDHLFDSGHFAKAPTLMRLLAFLVEQTLAGQGDQLKSYGVAVDGLGRDEDFDTQADSYPRVQVVRLRKLLEAYYARHEPAQNSCIFLKSGSYRVRLAPLTAAYPELVRAHPAAATEILVESKLADEVAGSPFFELADDVPAVVAAPGADQARGTWKRPHLPLWIYGLGSALLLSIGIICYLWFQSVDQTRAQVAPARLEPPVLLIEAVSTVSDARSEAVADDIYALLADGIGRSWLVRLRLENAAGSAATAKPSYRIAAQLGEANGGLRPLYLRLTDYETSNMLWSATVSINTNEPIVDSLGQAIAQLTGPFGVIAARERRALQGRYGAGYGCLLGYLANVAGGQSKVRIRLSSCLAQTNADAKLDAVRLAFRSFQQMEPSAGNNDRQAQVIVAMNFARQAIEADPKEAYAHFAMARIYFVSGKCSSGRQHALRSMEANPYDPVILAILGSFTASCGYPEGLTMLDQAYAFRSPGESHARLSLILAAIWQKRFDRLELLRGDGQETGAASASYHYLCEALIAAALDETDVARLNWQKFTASPHAKGTSDDVILQSVIMSGDIRARVLLFLRKKNVISAPVS